VTVFSDGTDEQLAPVLSLPGVRRAAPAVVDLIRMSRARVLVTTGTSSFSAWAAYLGGMPTPWYPGLAGRLLGGGAGLGPMVETGYGGSADGATLAGALARATRPVSSGAAS